MKLKTILWLGIAAVCNAQDKHPLLQAGPMVGHTSMVESAIWVQTTRSAEVRVEYWRENREPELSEPVHTDPDRYLTAKILLSGLAYGTEYKYRLHLDGEPVALPYAQHFKTQELWQHRTDPPDVRFALGSCFYVNDPPYDRPGDPYGGDYHILGTINAADPDFMLWLGDNTYLRESDFYSEKRGAYRYTHTRSLPELQPLLAARPNYAIWDDHDFGPNDSDRGYGFKHISLELFKSFWANPYHGHEDTPGIFCKVEWADLDLFLLDDRYHRAPDHLSDPQKPYLGEAQLQWLKDNLSYSRASFKFIVVGNQMINRYSDYESYSHYSGEFQNFTAWLRQSGVNGVVVLSGDRHFTELLKLDRPGTYPLYEFTCSPLTSGSPSALKTEGANPLRVPGTLVLGERNFGIVSVTGPPEKRVLTLQSHDLSGKLKWSRELQLQELTHESGNGDD